MVSASLLHKDHGPPPWSSAKRQESNERNSLQTVADQTKGLAFTQVLVLHLTASHFVFVDCSHCQDKDRLYINNDNI